MKEAQNAKKWLMKKGISKERIDDIGMGGEAPILSCDYDKHAIETHEKNRRIEIVKKINPTIPN